MSSKIIDEIVNQDYAKVTEKIERFLHEQITSTHANGLIFGLSGGIDSAVIAYICQRVMKKNSLALIMPDTKISPRNETEDALLMIDKIGLEYKLIDISPIVNEYSKYLEPNDFAMGNLRARIRMNLLYYYANSKNYLVLGSGDKSEYLIGYFTKYGDGGADIFPIVSLYKLQIRKLAEFLGVPQNVITKKSSPHLWKEHLAETEIGLTYEEIDPALYCIFDKKFTLEQTEKETGVSMDNIRKINTMFEKSKHKREPNPRCE